MSKAEKKDTAEQSEFRKHCSEWLAKNLPGPSPVRLPQSAIEITTQDQLDYLSAWQKSAPSWARAA